MIAARRQAAIVRSRSSPATARSTQAYWLKGRWSICSGLCHSHHPYLLSWIVRQNCAAQLWLRLPPNLEGSPHDWLLAQNHTCATLPSCSDPPIGELSSASKSLGQSQRGMGAWLGEKSNKRKKNRGTQ